MTLHLLQSPHSLTRALPSIAPNDCLLFMDRGLEALDTLTTTALPEHCQTFALSDTALTKQPAAAIAIIDYRQFVQLSIQHHHCLSW